MLQRLINTYSRSTATCFQIPNLTPQFFLAKWTHYVRPVRAVTDLQPEKYKTLILKACLYNCFESSCCYKHSVVSHFLTMFHFTGAEIVKSGKYSSRPPLNRCDPWASAYFKIGYIDGCMCGERPIRSWRHFLVAAWYNVFFPPYEPNSNAIPIDSEAH